LASDAASTAVRIPVWLWACLLADLKRKGAGRGESGAFLLGREGAAPQRVSSYICYDDIDPRAQQHGAIAFHAEGYAALWQHCKEKAVQVLADVHTHPGPDVRQSSIDQRHPMLPIVGHTAMIVPNFGRSAWWSLKDVGVYEHVGAFKWRDHPPTKTRRVRLSWW
jgi:proteasome lid subunit RPN8/RPN11